MRAGRDSPLRAESIGINVKRVHWIGFAIAGAFAGIAGGTFAFAKGTISPDVAWVSRSIDVMVMVLLGGIQTLTGPIVGAAVFTVLQDNVMRQTAFWRGLLGAVILLLVLVFPGGIVGALSKRMAARRKPIRACSAFATCRRPSAACTRSRTSASTSVKANSWR